MVWCLLHTEYCIFLYLMLLWWYLTGYFQMNQSVFAQNITLRQNQQVMFFYVLQQAIASSKLFLLHIVAKTKWQPFCWQHIQVHFIEWKLLWFYSNFTTICSQVFNSQYGSIGWDNGSVPYRRQTLISTNDGLVYWCILASLGLNELMNVMWYTHVYNMAKCLLILIVELW